MRGHLNEFKNLKRKPERTRRVIFFYILLIIFLIVVIARAYYALTNASIFYSGITLSHVPVAFTAPGSMYITVVNISDADSIPSYDPVYGAPRPVMNITEYGDVGQFIAGNYTGLLNRYGYLLYYNFKISFRVKRTQ